MNSKLFTILAIFLSIFLAALFFRDGDLVWLAFPFLVYAMVGLLQFPATDAIRLTAERKITQPLTRNEPVLDMEVTLSNQGGRIPNLYLVDTQPEGMKVVTGRTVLRTVVMPGGTAVLEYSFLQKRGRYAWDSIQAWVSDPFGLAAAQLSIPAQAEYSIQPGRDNFRRLALRPNSTLHSPGSIPARLAGSGTDFWGVRLYHPGDSLRWLDWRMTARHPGQFFTKEFEQEEIADIGLILDARQQTDFVLGEDSLLEHSVRAAASLAEGFLHQGHRVSLLVLSKKFIQVFPGYGKGQLNHILRCLAGVKAIPESKINSLEQLPLQMFSSHALLVILSPLGRFDEAFFPRLRAAGYQALLISPDPYDYAYPTIPGDQYSQQALRLARLERRIQLAKITRYQVRVIDWQVSQPLYPYVQAALGHMRGQRERTASI
jgi:uncharacterized protein (DUF58 family)